VHGKVAMEMENDHELLLKLNDVLQLAKREEKRAVLRVHRLTQQIQIVANRLDIQLPPTSSESPSNNNNNPGNIKDSFDLTELKNEVLFSQQQEPATHFLDTSTATLLPAGWSTAFDIATQKTYFYQKSTNTVQWEAPTSSSRSNSPILSTLSQRTHHNSRSGFPYSEPLNQPTNSEGKKRRGSVYDKLTDYKLYTGTHKNRFDIQGKGQPNQKDSSLANTKAGSSHHRRHSQYNGSTNTKSDELFHDASEFLVRDNFQVDGALHKWR